MSSQDCYGTVQVFRNNPILVSAAQVGMMATVQADENHSSTTGHILLLLGMRPITSPELTN